MGLNHQMEEMVLTYRAQKKKMSCAIFLPLGPKAHSPASGFHTGYCLCLKHLAPYMSSCLPLRPGLKHHLLQEPPRSAPLGKLLYLLESHSPFSLCFLPQSSDLLWPIDLSVHPTKTTKLWVAWGQDWSQHLTKYLAHSRYPGRIRRPSRSSEP